MDAGKRERRLTEKALEYKVEHLQNERKRQNCVEMYPVFLVALWSCAVFFNEMVAAGGGLLYMVARQIYFNGYVRAAKSRLPGFYLTVAVFFTLSLLGLIGILQGILHKYFHIRL